MTKAIDQSITVKNARLRFITVGSGRPAIVIPGGPGLGFTYLRESIENGLADILELTFYDQRGSGSSGGHEQPENLTIDQFVEDLDAVRKAIAQEKIILIGHSFGGLQAFYYTLRFPEHVSELIIIDGDPARFEDWISCRKVLSKRRTKEDQMLLARLSSTEHWDQKPDQVERYFQTLMRPYFYDPDNGSKLIFDFTPESFSKQNITSASVRADLGKWDFRSELEKIKCPVHLIYGEDTIFPLSAARSMAALLPNSNLTILPKTGHFPFLESPESLFKAISDFLKLS